MEKYDRAYYQSFADAKLVERFYAYIAELESLNSQHGWSLTKQFRSRWCAFKPVEHGKAAFGVAFDKEGLYLYAKVAEEETKSSVIRPSKYNNTDHQAEYHLDPSVKRLEEIVPLLRAAYRQCIE